MESIIQRIVSYVPITVIASSLWHQGDNHTALDIGILISVLSLLDYSLSSIPRKNDVTNNVVLWCLSPAGLLLATTNNQTVSTSFRNIAILIFLSGFVMLYNVPSTPTVFSSTSVQPSASSSSIALRTMVSSLVHIFASAYFEVDSLLSVILYGITFLSYRMFGDQLSFHDIIIFITSIDLTITDLYEMLVVKDNFHVSTLSLFTPRTCIIVFEVALISLLLMISLSYIVCNMVVNMDRLSPISSLHSSTAQSTFRSNQNITPILMRSIVFGGIVLLVSLLIVIPVLNNVLTMNPFIWLALLFQQNDYLAVYFTTYWIVVIASFVVLADWAMEKKKLSKTQGRKIFHGLMLVMFVPALLRPPIVPFVNLCLGGALCIFIMMEFIRLHIFQGDALAINQYFELFVSGSESNATHTIVLSHISLLLGCSSSIWYAGLLDDGFTQQNSNMDFFIPFAGLLTVGIGDSAAAIIGSSRGKHKWRGSNKTKEGSIAAWLSMSLSSLIFVYFQYVSLNHTLFSFLCVQLVLVTLAEVFIESNDNVSLPLFLLTTKILNT